jgi:hypothetical protein
MRVQQAHHPTREDDGAGDNIFPVLKAQTVK